MSRNLKLMLLLMLLLGLTACSTITSTDKVSAQGAEPWVLLPIQNFSSTPLAGEKVLTLLETQLRARGVAQIASFEPAEKLSLVALLDPSEQTEQATRWARDSGARYAISGTVHEWHYKTGTDKEPAVGLTLKLSDVSSGTVLWQGSAARTGLGYSNLSIIGNKVISDLLSKIQITGVAQ
ncbi:MAG: penicillin-binding protein activator LpoB [Gammaproteobacteria bacterium]|nr:penicillin-binding protein activator LpoB [Gammaproteobacteria bacterium]